MSERPGKVRRALKSITTLILAVWIGGAFVSGIYNNYTQKRKCINDEGWLKGWLSCSSETSHTFGFNMLSGLLWPVELLRTSPAIATKNVSAPTRLTQQQFDNSRVGTAYTCWAMAVRTDRKTDAAALAKMISWMKSQNQTLASMNNDYLYYAMLRAQQIESHEDLSIYYQTVCAKPIARIEETIDQGMIE